VAAASNWAAPYRPIIAVGPVLLASISQSDVRTVTVSALPSSFTPICFTACLYITMRPLHTTNDTLEVVLDPASTSTPSHRTLGERKKYVWRNQGPRDCQTSNKKRVKQVVILGECYLVTLMLPPAGQVDVGK